ncbi:head-tail connector protein [Aquibaculum sediminis]|uniref:head-tail connector protein n=1 Tax=Aquibaculum sediminis TaxID=3231907 RepID=UPI003454774E
MHALPPVLVTPPSGVLLSLAEAKAHLNIDVDATYDDFTINTYIDAATAYLDGYHGILGRALLNQTWKQSYAEFSWLLRLRLAPVLEVTQLTYYDRDGQQQTVDSEAYSLFHDDLGPLVTFHDDYQFPSVANRPDAVTVTYECGVGDQPVPHPVKQAALLLVGHWYEHREAVSEVAQSAVPMAVDALVAPYRRVGLR